MDVKKVMLLIGALVIAAVTAVMAKNMFAGSSAPVAQAAAVEQTGPKVLVATRALPVGTIVDAESLKYQVWPEELQQPSYFIEGQGASAADLIGSVVRTEITAGQPVTNGSLVKPGDRGFLAAALGPGMRAVTVSVSDTSGVAGFVFPGDRVDLVLTQEVAGGGDGSPLKASETILRNVRVLATDRRLTAANEEGKSVAQSTSTVTLEATPKIAEKIAVAQTIGTLSLSLRSLADNAAELERAIAAGDVDVPADGDPAAERRMLLAIAAQPADSNPTYTIGSDVSRFQRASVPGRAPQESATGPVPAGNAVEAPPRGPSVRVARGNNVTVVPVGAK